VGGAAQVTGQLPFSPVAFWLLAKLAELWPTEACLPQARTVESAEEISDEGAPEPILRAAGPGRNDRG
jgi:hypothetical protein